MEDTYALSTNTKLLLRRDCALSTKVLEVVRRAGGWCGRCWLWYGGAGGGAEVLEMVRGCGRTCGGAEVLEVVRRCGRTCGGAGGGAEEVLEVLLYMLEVVNGVRCV